MITLKTKDEFKIIITIMGKKEKFHVTGNESEEDIIKILKLKEKFKEKIMSNKIT